MKRTATKKHHLTLRSFTKTIARYAQQHKGFTAVLALLLVLLVLTSTTNPGATLAQVSLFGRQPKAEILPEQPELNNNIDELAKLKVSKDAIDNSEPVSTAEGKCESDSMYNSSDGKLSVASRLSDGSWRCVTYNLEDLQNYESADGAISVQTDPETGQRKTVVQSTDETGATTKTTTVTNSDGSGQSSTEGGYSKMIIGPTNDGRQIFGFFDYTDNRQYTDVGRFMSCYITQNFYTYTDGNSYFDGTYRELGASEKASRAGQSDCSRLPVLQYESAAYNLPLLKTCLRNGTHSAGFDTATCYRQASSS